MKYTGLSFLCLLMLFFLSFSSGAFSQESFDYQESQYQREMDEGADMMNQGKFLSADLKFKEVLSKVTVVPPDLCFYFGKNSYHLKKYKQSIDWLGKYIELKGTSGQFFDQAVEYLDMAKADFQAEKAKGVKTVESTTAPKKEILDCEQYPFVTCPVCQGSGVMVEQGKLGSSIYKTCPYSDQYGRMSCEDYKLYVKGKLNPKEEK